MSEVLSQEWRVEHCKAGDKALEDAQEIADRDDGDTGILAAAVQAFAAIAQAHYAAANVRARLAAPKVAVVPEGVHVRVDGWCFQCGGTGEPETPHQDVP